MAIEGVKNVQVAGYQASQTATKPVEQVSIGIPDTAVDTQRREASNEQIKKAVSDMNKRMSNTSCQFGVHEGTGRVTIKIIDKDTKDVIKEFPAEKTLEMIEKAWELAGIMVDEKR